MLQPVVRILSQTNPFPTVKLLRCCIAVPPHFTAKIPQAFFIVFLTLTLKERKSM
jgi:hypothetical protein